MTDLADREDAPVLEALDWYDEDDKKLKKRFFLGGVNGGSLIIRRNSRGLRLFVRGTEIRTHPYLVDLMNVSRSLVAIAAGRQVYDQYEPVPTEGRFARDDEYFLCNLAEGEYIIDKRSHLGIEDLYLIARPDFDARSQPARARVTLKPKAERGR
jgi:hypothetical protein